MAWVEQKGRRFAVVFRFGGARYKRLLDTHDRREADAVAARAERRIELVLRGDHELPPESDVVEALLGDAVAKSKAIIPSGLTLQTLSAAYWKTIESSSLEPGSRGAPTRPPARPSEAQRV